MNPQQRIAELEAQLAIMTRLLEVNKTMNAALLSSSLRVEALLGYIMDAAAVITDAEAASILLWNQNTQELFFVATTTNSHQSRALIGKPVPLDSLAGTILREQRAVYVDNVKDDPRHYTKVDSDIQFQTRSLLGVPMVSKSRAIGVLEVLNKRTLPWAEQDQQNLLVLANEAAVAIEVAQLVVMLQKANTELSQLDKLKSDFIAIASHELRTPLGVILGYASFLQDEASTPEAGELAAKVIGSALQLRKIIDDMINLRYLKQKEGELHRESVRLYDLLVDMETDAQTVIEAKGHNLRVERPAGDVRVLVDETRIQMALTNILNNAARFTPEGGEIQVRWQIRGNEAWVSFTDNGIGIAEHDLENIFTEFYQVEDHMTRKHGGLGIGLSIARALINAHGGRIWAESAGLGLGSTFTLTLPLA